MRKALVLALLLFWALGSNAMAAALEQAAGPFQVSLEGTAGADGQAVYKLRVTDQLRRPVRGARVKLTAELPGAFFSTSAAGLSGLAEAEFRPAGDPGVYGAELQYPAQGIWRVTLDISAGSATGVLRFEENIGSVWTDEARGIAMLGGIGAGVALFAWLGIRHRRAKQAT